MKLGAWHQCGDKSQKMAVEELKQGKGVGVVLSPRDILFAGAKKYGEDYRNLGAGVAIDPQFFVPSFTNPKLGSYPIDSLRQTMSSPHGLTSAERTALQKHLESINKATKSTLLIAPALICEAGRDDILDLNIELLDAAVSVGGQLGIPTLATVFIGQSASQSDTLVNSILSGMTSVSSDGYYFAFEFGGEERIPSSTAAVKRLCRATLSLACTGQPVFHAYAGPLGVLTIPCGAECAGVGHPKNVWHFQRSRWLPPPKKPAGWSKTVPPPRFFSRALWGTIVYQDETLQLQTSLQSKILVTSPFSAQQVGMRLDWDKWNAHKHLVSVICDELTALTGDSGKTAAFVHSVDLLSEAVGNLKTIAATGVKLRDNADAYQQNWLTALTGIQTDEKESLDFLTLLR